MINQVKYLQEALQRFSPDARLEYELSVQGVSPSTQCSVTFVGFDPKDLDEAVKGRDDLDARCDELIEGLIAIHKEAKNKFPNMKAILDAIDLLNLNDEIKAT